MRACWLLLVGSVAACGGSAPGPAPQPDAGVPFTTDTSIRTYALSKVYLGEATRKGDLSATAWASFGWNLDGKSTTGSSTDVCTLAPGAPSSNQGDGTAGIDNAFGRVLLPLFESMLSEPEPSKLASAALQSGTRTIQLRVVGAAADGLQTATGLSIAWLPSREYAGDGPSVPFPGFWPTTDWPVRAEGLADGATLASPRALFDPADVTFGKVHAALPSVKGTSDVTLTFALSLGAVELPLVIHHAGILFTPKAEHLTEGTFAGVLDVDEFVASFVRALSPQICGDNLAGLERQLRQAADLLKDGTNAKGRPCDGISIGLGFDAELIANPTKVAKSPVPVAEPCP